MIAGLSLHTFEPFSSVEMCDWIRLPPEDRAKMKATQVTNSAANSDVDNRRRGAPGFYRRAASARLFLSSAASSIARNFFARIIFAYIFWLCDSAGIFGLSDAALSRRRRDGA